MQTMGPREALDGQLPRIRGMIRAMAGGGPVDDIAQECCLRVIQKESLWSPSRGRAVDWIMAVARNVARGILRRARPASPELPQPAPAAWSDEELRWVLEEFFRLSDADRSLLHQKYFDGLTLDQIARRTGVSHQAVSERMARTLDKLKRRAKERGLAGVFAGAIMTAKAKTTAAAILTAALLGGMAATWRWGAGWRAEAQRALAETKRLSAAPRPSETRTPAILDRPAPELPVAVPEASPAPSAPTADRYRAVLAWLQDLSPSRFRNLTAERLASIQELDLTELEVRDADLAKLAVLPNLLSLKLTRTAVTDVGMVHLAGCASLESLTLAGTSVGDAGLAALGPLRKLAFLDLFGTPVTDEGLRHLADLPLRDLGLWGTKVTDAGLAHLRSSSTLEEIHLVNTAVGDAGLSHLQGLSNLRVLDLRNTRVTDAGLSLFGRHGAIESLQLLGTSVTDAGLQHFSSSATLRSLGLACTGVTDAGLQSLRLGRLRELDVRQTGVTADWLARFKKDYPDCRWVNCQKLR